MFKTQGEGWDEGMGRNVVWRRAFKKELSNNIRKFKNHTTFTSGMDIMNSQLVKLGENAQILLKISHKNDTMHLQQRKGKGGRSTSYGILSQRRWGRK